MIEQTSPPLPFDPPINPDGSQTEPQVRIPATLLQELLHEATRLQQGVVDYADLPDTELPDATALSDVLARVREHCRSAASCINTVKPVSFR